MERVAEGKIDLTSREYRGFPPLLGQIINKGLSKISKNAKINFQGEKDIIDFLSGIARSLENGVIDNKNVEAIKKKAKDREKLVKEIKKSKGEKKAELLKSIGITPEMRDRSERADEIYRNEGEDGVWTSIEEGIFDSIINKIPPPDISATDPLSFFVKILPESVRMANSPTSKSLALGSLPLPLLSLIVFAIYLPPYGLILVSTSVYVEPRSRTIF